MTDKAPFWAETGPTAYQILIGLNIETSLMFAIFGLVYAKSLPADRAKRILGMPNRLTLALVYSLLAVAIEVVLNALGLPPLALLVVELPLRPADLRLRLPLVLPLRGLRLRPADERAAISRRGRARGLERRAGAYLRPGAWLVVAKE